MSECRWLAFRSFRESSLAAAAMPSTNAAEPGLVYTAAPRLLWGLNWENNEALAAKPFRLAGPGTVTGLARANGEALPLVVRHLVPPVGTGNFSPNFFASLEFWTPDFPWLVTPEKPAGKQLAPWLMLLAIKKSEFELKADDEGSWLRPAGPQSPLPSVHCKAAHLPDPAQSWMTAHVSVNRPGPEAAPPAETTVTSRLLCLRRLEPDEQYVAIVVPRYENGRRAGLGLPLDAALEVEPAWSLADPELVVELPVYHHWEFGTGPRGDFEHLAGLLRGRLLDGQTGLQSIDVSNPGLLPPPGVESVDVPGALRAPAAEPRTLAESDDFVVAAEALFNEALSSAAEEPGESESYEDPIFTPPVYGRWHLGGSLENKVAAKVNTQPGLRALAARGAAWVRKNQSALVAESLRQLSRVEEDNETLANEQLTAAISEKLHRRLFSGGNAVQAARVGNLLENADMVGQLPLFGLVTTGALESQQVKNARSTTTRSLRINAKWRKRVGLDTGESTQKIFEATEQYVPANVLIAGDPWVEQGPALATRTRSVLGGMAATLDLHAMTPDSRGLAATPTPGSRSLAAQPERAADLIGAAPSDSASTPETPAVPPLVAALSALKKATAPQARLDASAAKVAARYATDSTASTSPTRVRKHPVFTTPLCDEIGAWKPEWLVPGIGTIPENSVALLATSPELECLMLGANHELASELLWRDAPVDLRATFFRHAWGKEVPQPDFSPIADWEILGENGLQAPVPESECPGLSVAERSRRVVILVKGLLLERFPDTAVYIAEYRHGEDPAKVAHPPVFRTAVSPDVVVLGFNIPVCKITDGQGVYELVFAEPVTQPTFGLDVDNATADKSKRDDLHWGWVDTAPGEYLKPPSAWDEDIDAFPSGSKDRSSVVAHMTLQKPVLVQVPAEKLIRVK